MAKIKWEITRVGCGVQYEVVASTRAGAIAVAEADYLELTSCQDELIGSTNEDGTAFCRSPVPDYTAKKLCRA